MGTTEQVEWELAAIAETVRRCEADGLHALPEQATIARRVDYLAQRWLIEKDCHAAAERELSAAKDENAILRAQKATDAEEVAQLRLLLDEALNLLHDVAPDSAAFADLRERAAGVRR